MSEIVLKKIEKFKQEWGKADAKRDEGLSTSPKGIKRYDNLSYGSHGKDNLFDIYLPEDHDLPIPMIISIHGGGFFYGNKEGYQFYCLGMAQRGFGVVNFNYRLAPDHPYPAALEDVNEMMNWLGNHARDYGLDPQSIFVVGDSAGGQLAEQYLTILSNPDFKKLFDYNSPKLRILAAGLNSALSCLADPESIPEDSEVEAYFGKNALEKWGQQLRTEEYLTKDFPPVYIVTAVDDFLKHQSLQLAEKLKKVGVNVQQRVFGDDQHPRGHDFQLDQRDELAKECNDLEADFFHNIYKSSDRSVE